MGHYGITDPLRTPEEDVKILKGTTILIIGLFSFLILPILFWNLVLFHDAQVAEFQIESATVSGLKVRDSMLTGTWDFNLVAINTNKKVTFTCDTIEASLFKNRRNYYATNHLPSLFINSSSLSYVKFSLGLVNQYIDADEAIEIFEEKTTRGLVQFKLRLVVDFTFRTKFWDVWDLEDSGIDYFTCDPVPFVFSPNNDTGIFTDVSPFKVLSEASSAES